MDVWNPCNAYEVGHSHALFRKQQELQCNATRNPNVYLVYGQSLPNLAQSTYMDVGEKMNDLMWNSRYHQAMDTSEEIKHGDFSHDMSQGLQPLPFSIAPEVKKMLLPGFDVADYLSSTMNYAAGYGSLDSNRRGGAVFADMSPYLCLGTSNQVVGRLSSKCKVYPSVVANRTTSRSEEVMYPQIQLPEPRQHCYRPPTNLFDHQPDIQSQTYLDAQDELSTLVNSCNASSYDKQSQTCLVAPDELSKWFASCNVSSYDILLQYKKYKNTPVNVGKVQIPFLSYLHWSNCSSNRCMCKQFQLLVSHFDNCIASNCKACSPPLVGCSSYDVSSSSGIWNSSSLKVYGNNPRPAKRVRFENLPPSYHRKLTTPEGPVIEMQEMIKKTAISKRAGVHQHFSTSSNQKSRYSNSSNSAEEVNNSSKLLKAGRIITSEVKAATANKITGCAGNHIMGSESENKHLIRSRDTKSETTSCLTEHIEDIGSLTGLQESKKVVSLIDMLTADQIEEHIHSLAKEPNEKSTDALGKSLCQLCAMDKLLFNPAPIYCVCCGSPIKKNLIHHWTSDEKGGKHYLCARCLRKSKGKIISVQGLSFAKSDLHKGKHIEEAEESVSDIAASYSCSFKLLHIWVQCGQCELWQHQICALYNSKSDSEGKEKYACPSCRLQEIKIGKHMPRPPLGAKDLPRTKLSDHIELRLHSLLKEERQERAMSLGKCVDEVPGAENLVVRVVILLFQKIKGVDVCLFAMFVQEHGSDCSPPNQNSVYISYLDSVKYFQPELQTLHGEALRTYVLDTLTIARNWVSKRATFGLALLRRVMITFLIAIRSPKKPRSLISYDTEKESVVLGYTNFYDRFFVPNAQCSTKVTTANLPYFDGAYWSVVAEEINSRITMDGGGSAAIVNNMSKRNLKAMGHTNLSDKSATDILVMQQLGQDIYKVKEDFIIVNLQFICSSCHKSILSPNHWTCGECKSFRVCPRCINVEESFREKTHFIGDEQHALSEIVVDGVPQNTDDEDVVLDTDIFENRNSFLTFSRENHYQFDSLRHAKYSSTMILYHLHKQISRRLATICGICQKRIMINDGRRCEASPAIIVCSTCYGREGNHAHIHEPTHRASMTEHCTTDKQPQKQETSLFKEETLKSIVHAFQYDHSKEACSDLRCFQFRRLFHHRNICKKRVTGGCQICRMAWDHFLVPPDYCFYTR
ncbi:hypothetical protein Leryth_025410 [Lithospermum erythrorhizon]|nr:hypothetical protein Leryth_025410 [Lithospermum erythrorhizon]